MTYRTVRRIIIIETNQWGNTMTGIFTLYIWRDEELDTQESFNSIDDLYDQTAFAYEDEYNKNMTDPSELSHIVFTDGETAKFIEIDTDRLEDTMLIFREEFEENARLEREHEQAELEMIRRM